MKIKLIEENAKSITETKWKKTIELFSRILVILEVEQEEGSIENFNINLNKEE